MNSKKIIFLLSFSLILFNCSSDSNDDLNDDDNMVPVPETITYDGQIKSIINNNCTQCHGSTLANGAPFSLTTFADVSGRVDRIIARTNSSTSPMPPSGQIGSSLRDMIQQWKDDGLLEN